MKLHLHIGIPARVVTRELISCKGVKWNLPFCEVKDLGQEKALS